MMVLRIALAAFAVAALAVAASAAPTWKGAGWYVVVYTVGGAFFASGPYRVVDDCEAQLPPDSADKHYDCERLSKRPDWIR